MNGHAEDGSAGTAARSGKAVDFARTLARRLGGPADLETLQRLVVGTAAEVTGAERAALLRFDDSPGAEAEHPEGLVVEACLGDDGLPAVLAPQEASGQLWTAVDAENLTWGGVGRADSAPLARWPGWEQGIALRLPGPAPVRILVAAGLPDAELSPQAIDRLETTAAIAASALARQALLEERELIERLLQGALVTSARLLGATDPHTARQRVVDDLVGVLGFDGAALWCQDEASGEPLVTESAGLPLEVREALVAHRVHPRVRALLAAPEDPRPAAPEGEVEALAWPGRFLRLVRLPPPAAGVLGVFCSDSMSPLVQRVLASLAHATAAAVRQTTLYAERRDLLAALRRELRPREILPGGADVAEWYRAATVSPDAFGGDFYDWFTTPRGQIGLAIGDVAGKGINAASLSSMAVWSLRAFAHQGASPQTVLNLLDRFLVTQISDDRFITLAYVLIDLPEWTARVGLAGHPAPILLDAGGARPLPFSADPPLGLGAGQHHRQHAFTIAPGQSLVCFTDGVTEAREANGPTARLFGMRRLRRLLAELYGASSSRIVSEVWAQVHRWTDGGTSDDCALLVLTRPPAGPEDAG